MKTGEDDHPAPAPMEGRGAYNRNSRVQAAGLAAAIPLFEKAARNCTLSDSSDPVVIADYGASEGRNSLAPIAAAIAILRQRIGTEREISIVHTDLPDSDFSALFRTLVGDPDSYLCGGENIYPSAVGRSFYEQILPSNSVTLGWSSWAVQWLSRMPARIPDQVHVSSSQDAVAHAAFAAQADYDWRMFLNQRSRELRVGGRLVVLTMALTWSGDFGYHAVLRALYGGLQDLAFKGEITAEELSRMVIPTVGRSRSDLIAPFGLGNRFADLAVEHAEVFLEADRIWQQYETDRDSKAYGARWAAFSRASVFPTLALALEPADDPSRVQNFIASAEAHMAARLAAAPEPCDIPLAKLVLAKLAT
jgi:hypothetical protein